MDAWEIWNAGKPLASAHLHFGSQDKVSALRKYATENSNTKMFERLQANLESGKGFLDSLQGVTGDIKPKNDLLDEVRREILQHIGNGNLKAFGFETPRRANDTPIEVPADLWRGWVRWDKSLVEAQSLKIENVRLVPSNHIEKQIAPALTTAQSDGEPFRPAGRPSRKDHIIAAFHALNKAGEIDFNKPAKHCYPAIRAWVKAHYPEDENPDRGLGDKAIQLHVNPLFNAAKNSD
ncbi:hypothetical protein P8T57_01230 [Thalassospira sp. SN3W]|uniref:hypothetical protein n=1 Tax=Thalassospira sp. SN3W TaxID=3035476 RepID=UPI00311ACEEC